MKKLLLLLLILSFTSSCQKKTQTSIPDVTKDQQIKLVHPGAEPHGLTIEFAGKIDGKAKIWLEGYL